MLDRSGEGQESLREQELIRTEKREQKREMKKMIWL